ncbi:MULTISPECIES: WXG100 family type VII secretion target [Prauserella salsuginis group]|uniref:WXG100 family type VII secretion target n=1 Tax=Prauserella salsuginis TaxID=387889 RepID=A0ABW6G2M6_9PSEU|nr:MULTISPECIES: WXG100 family type VII secretion target [Prauserella salsuginis group]MCR3719795.1 WXG100 family type VII secretion target [Prauserella flava]MCR3736662.1 WXG100 family type VII secretion target [Prauserella salsuginis]
MSEYTWEETKEILDDPYVSADTKQAVLGRYSMSGDGNDAAEDYYEKYNVTPHPYPGGYGGDPYGGGSWGNYDGYDSDKDPYERAREESEEGSYRGRQIESKLEDNSGELDQAQPPGSSSSSTTSITTSDELLELAKDALDTFHKFLPIDAEAPADSQHIDGPLDYASDIRERYWEQGGIDFQKFLDDAEQLRKAHGTLQELQKSTQQDLNSLYRDWTGDAANASYQRYSEDIEPNSNELIEHLSGASEVIETAVRTVFDTVKYKAEQVIQLYTPTVGQATPDVARKVMKLARGDFDNQDQVLEVAAWVDSVCGSNLESTIRADDCGLNDENKELVITETKTWIRESWNVDLYENLYASFKSLCDSTKEAVDQAYGTLNEYLGEYENGFPAQPGGQQPGGQQPGVDAGVGTPGAGAGTPGGGAGTPNVPTPGPGVSTPGGGGGAPGGGASGGGGGAPATPTPEVPTPESPEMPEFETPGPGTGGPGNSDGSDTDVTTPQADLDTDGEPDSLLGTPGGDRDKLTVEEGDNKLEITEPDEDGRMEISVDGGEGPLKDYQLDFGADDNAAGTGEPGDFGPKGTGGAGDGAAGDKVYRPDPDGKIRIEDGDMKIVAERPDVPGGPTLVTVDDGEGEPTTYTLDGLDDGSGGGIGSLSGDFTPSSSISGDLGDTAAGAGAGAGGVGAGGVGGSDSIGAGAGSIGAGAGSVGGGGGGGFSAEGEPQQPLDEGSRTSGTTAPPASGAPAAAAAPSGGDAGGGAGGGRGGMGGGMMGAPMGGAGAGGQGGGQERTSSYRIDGGLFDGSESPQAITGTIGDDPPAVRYDK